MASKKSKLNFNFLKIAKISGIVFGGIFGLVILIMIVAPRPYYSEGFENFDEVKEYSKDLDEFMKMTGKNYITPDYSSYYQKKFVVTLGGDHSVAIGPINAHSDFHKDISILHLDAHADMRDSYENNKFSHASVMARAKEKVNNIVSVGIRSMDISEKNSFKKGNLFLAEDVCCGSDKWITQVVKKLGKKVYLTLDVDVFDSGIMPSTGTPEPGGLNWYQITKLIHAVCKTKELVGMDIVELAPNPVNKAPDFLVAKLIFKVLSYKFAKNQIGNRRL